VDWNDLKYCAHVAREGSTLAAARVLHTSQTTVMRRIAALEQALGFELFEKRRAGYVPTDALRALLPKLDAIEAAHAAFEDEAAHTGRSLRGTVRLTASELMVSHFLSSALAAFSAEYPDIRIELFTSDRFLDLTRGEADIAVRAGDPPTEPSLFGRCIVASDVWHICCSRAYAERHGMPRTVDDLTHHNLITVLEGQFKSPITDWVQTHVRKERIAFRHNSLMTIYMSVKAGLGVSPCPDILSAVDADLVRCMPLPVDPGKGLWVLAPERLKKARHVRILLDFLANHMSAVIRNAEKRLEETGNLLSSA
jgi:DNA-binding transcriptional LysR family regulator